MNILNGIRTVFCGHMFLPPKLLEPARTEFNTRYCDTVEYEAVYGTKCVKCGKAVKGCRSEIAELEWRTNEKA